MTRLTPLLFLTLLAACGDPVPTTADILPADTTIVEGAPVQFEVEVRDQDGDLMRDVQGGSWSVADGPLEVNATGVVEGSAYGSGTVQYTIEDVIGEATVRVNPRLTLTAAMSYVNQAIQTPDDPIPLIPGRDGLLRLFVAVEEEHYYSGPLAVRVEMPNGYDTTLTRNGIRKTVNEGDLRWSYNAIVPGDLIEAPEVRVKVTYDPEDEIDGIDGQETLVFEADQLPRFDLMVVPTVSSVHPRRQVTNWANPSLTFGHSQLWAVRKLLPVSTATGRLEVHDVLEVDYGITTGAGWVRWLNDMNTLRAAEGRRDYYLGVMRHAGGGIGGIAYLGRPAVVASDIPATMSHELGHGMYLQHAPCNVSGDPAYPHPNGDIGQWGIDIETMSLKPPHFKDHMGYCFTDTWVSDFFFNKSLNRRKGSGLRVEEEPVLVLSGDITAGVFQPAFALDGVAARPDPAGTHLLTGVGEDGSEVFSFRFTPLEVMDADAGLGFHVAVPYSLDRDGRLARVTLTGPSVAMTLHADSHPLTVFERGPGGQVVRITTDHPGPVPAGSLGSRGLPR